MGKEKEANEAFGKSTPVNSLSDLKKDVDAEAAAKNSRIANQ
jgi:hypothetical protein